ncbi:hypothetical protein [Clostridium botulinum]|nr:hypothetical protein [Clostridium botulinum]
MNLREIENNELVRRIISIKGIDKLNKSDIGYILKEIEKQINGGIN